MNECESRPFCDDKAERLAEAEAEIERLRAALLEIATMAPPMDNNGRVYDAEQRIARAALEGKG